MRAGGGEAPGRVGGLETRENADMARFLAVGLKIGVISPPLGGKTGLTRDTH